MNNINLYNTLERKLTAFKPIDSNNVRMYACGPTVYDYIHIGNARPLVVFDVLVRVLRTVYPKVTYVRNITDIDDKINNRALEKNISISDLTKETIKNFHIDCEFLGNLKPDVEPKATDHIDEIIDMIKQLISGGFAYVSSGHVLFSVVKYKKYGVLSGRSLDDMISGSRVEVAAYKENPGDFILWKPSIKSLPGWDSPWGRGRPGWHIECSAMSKKYLGDQFDIHAGGLDLIFPHHENEIAQSECASGNKFANYWLHSGLLKINGEKMSKSLGNFAMLKDLFISYHPEVIRYYLVSSHYRSSLNFDQESLNQAKSALTRLYQALASMEGEGNELDQDTMNQFSLVMNDDLNTPEALSLLFQLAKSINNSSDPIQKMKYGTTLKKLSGVLGLLQDDPKTFFQFGATLSDEEIDQQIALRNVARDEKDFQTADKIRDSLIEQGIILDDSSDGTTWKKS